MKITTVKLSQETKVRLERLKSHKRDSYEDILINILEILNTCRLNPEKARIDLINLEKKHYQIFKQKYKENQKEQKPEKNRKQI